MMFSHKRSSKLFAHNCSFESNCGLSNVVPDMSLSLRQLIERHMSGGNVTKFSPQFLPESSKIPVDLERMGKLERAALLKELPQFIATSRGNIISARELARRNALLAAGGSSGVDLESSPAEGSAEPVKSRPSKQKDDLIM